MQTISPKMLEKIKQSDSILKVINRLAYEFDVYSTTAKRWIDTNDIKLTLPAALRAISEETGIPESELLTPAA